MVWGFSTLSDVDRHPTPLGLTQVHGCSIVEALKDGQYADGIWTKVAGLPIGVRSADCVPILLAGLVQNQPWVAAVHAGWKGATAGILRRIVAVFTNLGGNPNDLTWALGPAILKCHFEVGEEVIAAAKQDAAWFDELVVPGPKKGKFHLDLHGLLRAQAVDLGLDLARDGSIALCTYCHPKLLSSYRRDSQCERQWSWIEIIK